MEEEETELRNPFPSPPSHHSNYTAQNLRLFQLLRERVKDQDVDISTVNQHNILSDQTDIPSWPLTQLEKPRVDWILEEGHYNVFGDTWFVKETIPSLAELGGHQLYPADPSTGESEAQHHIPRALIIISLDRRPALLSILRSLLVTYSNLTGAILAPPPPPHSTAPPEWQRHVEWITVLAQNLMAAANDLRPVQARGNLESMMQRQLELRREETVSIHTKCDELEARLLELRATVLDAASHHTASDASQQGQCTPPVVTIEDVLRWAEQPT
ncbi:mediator complex, subunit Med7 [Lanmaoa asiatica]|nr:mediator complex, subunit Med7 [Lanmaoa asiatica]